jgi:RHS repeat-associated protein
VSLLAGATLRGHRRAEDGTAEVTELPTQRFTYSTFDVADARVESFTSTTSPPPPLGDDVTLVDRAGTGLPGVLQMNGDGARYWENRGRLRWGPPQEDRHLPQRVALGTGRLRFADLDGTTTADLVVAGRDGTGYHPNDPEAGFGPKVSFRVAPSVAITDPDTWLLDLDGDRTADLLTFRNGVPLGFLNRGGGTSWSPPRVLPRGALPDLAAHRDRVRFADMTGDGQPDCVLVRSRQVTWWPNLGDGRFGDPQPMAATPEFDVPDAARDVLLADVDGDGTADLVLVGHGTITIHLNVGGLRYGEPIRLGRTPNFAPGRTVLTDMTGAGTRGLLWTNPGDGTYHYLDPTAGTKPYLLTSIDNGQGLATTITYATSVDHMVADRDGGEPPGGYLPFPVQVVTGITRHDRVLDHTRTTSYTYHDGNYDRRAREYLGFGRVDATAEAAHHAAPSLTRYYFHNRAAGGPGGFAPGKGHPYRTELVNPATGEVRKVDRATWDARPVTGSRPHDPAYLGVEAARESERIDGGAAYHRERIEFAHDDAGNRVREHRRGEWAQPDGTPRVDELVIEHDFADHPTHGRTSIESRTTKRDGSGRLLARSSMFYDGDPFAGLPLGQVTSGFKARQRDVVLTAADVADAYGTPPPLLDELFATESDPEFGTVWVRDSQRCRVDAAGNELETIDGRGHRVALTYGPDGIHPTSVSEDGGAPRELHFDPICGQVTLAEDRNGNTLRFRYDALGNVVAVHRRDAVPGKPTETYEYDRATVPVSVTKRVRVNAADAEPGHVQVQYMDGSARVAQVKTRAEDGRWAAQKQSLNSFDGVAVSQREAYFSSTEAFDLTVPAGVLTRSLSYDFASRLVTEEHFNGTATLYVHDGPATRVYAPDAAADLLSDPDAPPTRSQVHDAWDRVVSVADHDGTRAYEQARAHDPLGRPTTVTDCLGHVVTRSTYDLAGNRTRVESADAGSTSFVYDALDDEVLRVDGEGRALYHRRDVQGRTTEVRDGGPTGPVVESFTYDTGPGDNMVGRLARVEGNFGTADYSYAPEGNPTRIRRTYTGDARTFDVGFAYDGQGSVTSVTYPDGSEVAYRYHPNGMLAAIPGVIDDIDYDASGRRTRVVYANGLETTRTTGADDGFLAEIVTRPVGGGPALQHLVHTYDLIGQVVAIDDRSSVAGKVRNDQAFTYDRLHRLVGATGRGAGGDYSFTYAYDELGNLTHTDEADGGTGTAAGDLTYGHQVGRPEPNRLVRRAASATDDYEYDAAGNLTLDPAVGRMHYDVRHRLVRVERPDGSEVAYTYDHNGHRCATTVTGPPGSGTASTLLEVERVYLVDAQSATRVVVDQRERLAVIPDTGDALLYHLDRLGNVNVVSNLATGAFAGHNEFGPYGTLTVSITLQPNFSFQGARFDEGLDLVLLGARHYRPALGRFLAPDAYLLVRPNKLPGFQVGCNLYAYALANPTNTTDKTGQIAFLAVLLIAVAVGAVVGAIGAAATGAKTWDEWVLYIVGGAIGGALVALTAGGLAVWLAGCAAAATWAGWAVAVWGIVSVLGSLITPALDDSDSTGAWVVSFVIKWIQSPVTTTIGAIAAAIVAIGGGNVDFERGMLFIDVGGSDYGAITFGGVAWTLGGGFDADGNVDPALAEHEALHSRQVVALGELGFYVTYITLGGIFGAAQGGPWIGLNNQGCGNPFEKTPWPIDHPGSMPKPAHDTC